MSARCKHHVSGHGGRCTGWISPGVECQAGEYRPVPGATVVATLLEGRAQGLSNAEVAESLGLTPGGLKSAIRRARHSGLLTESGTFRSRGGGRPREEVLEDFVMIKDSVSSLAQAADRMGMTLRGLEQALGRARKAGDERGVYFPLAIGRVHPRSKRVSKATRDKILAQWPGLREEGHTLKSAAPIIGHHVSTVSSTVGWAIKNGHPAGLRPITRTSSQRPDHPFNESIIPRRAA